MSIFSGSLETDSSYQPFLSFFKVRLRFRMPIDEERVAVERSAAVQTDGTYQIDIAEEARTDPAATLSVLGPTSELLAGGLLAELLGDDFQLKPIRISGRAPEIVLKPLTEEERAPLRRLKIRVFVAELGVIAGKVAAGVDVQLLGRRRGADQATPLASGTTDAQGYLSLTVANVPFDALRARIGRGVQTHETAIPLTDAGKAPLRIILTTPATTAVEDCHCELAPPRLPDAGELAENGDVYSADLGAGCEDFTIPNRTLEEFDFFLIVRTTDPDIRGLTLPEEVSAQVAGGPLRKLAFDRATLSQELRTVDLVSAPAATTQAVNLTGSAAASLRAEGRSLRELAGSRSLIDETGASQPSLQLQEVLPAYVDVRPLAAAGTITAAQWRESTDEKIAEASLDAALAKIPARTLRAALQDPDGFTPVRLMTIERCASIDALKKYLDARRKKPPGRAVLDEDNPVDWDETPEFYQASSIAHGHLLHFKQEWKADGYSLGELVKSIPLAPGQKKQIAILDWDREDTAGRSEVREAGESLAAFLSRDRDINEITNAAFRESIRGGSRARTGAVGGGFGFAIGPLVIGGGGGAAWSSSTAWNEGSRDLTGQTLNQLREEISQGVSTVRNQRSAVIQTVGQRERVTAMTEVIANHNRCHAMTIQYFEVLRHFAVQERLAGVQECLFVPLQMALFDDAKVLRWRDLLSEACRQPALREGFESIWRLSSPATTPPDRAFADDPIEEMSGRIFLRVSIARPKDPDEASRAVLEQTEWRFFGIILRVHPEVVYEQYRRNEQRRDQIFRSEIAPEIARQFVESLRVVLIDRDGNEHEAGFDLSLLSRYVEGGLMEVALNDSGRGPRLSRRELAGIEIRTDHALPEYSRVIVEQANIDYRTQRFAHPLYRHERVLDDVLANDPAFLSTAALSRAEERNQLREERQRRRRLLRHLNDHLEYYHRAIWWQMDAARRFLLLDGFEAPNAGGRSVASVVENRLIGIVGNALVMPVAPGFQLDPALRQVLKEGEDPLVALNTLYDTAPSLPRRHSVPTKGVFAEAMNGKCNACEVIEEDRFWRWKDFPLPDSPPPIGELSTDSRFATPESLAPAAFPEALVKFQNVPGAPLPSGMNAALNLLGKDVFKDLTGLTQNQKNAMAALTTAFGSSEAFAGEAFKLALAQDAARNLDRTIDQAEAAKKAGLLTDEEASKATRDALLRALGEEGAGNKEVTELPGVRQALDQLGNAPSGSATVTRSSGENSETVEVKKEGGSALAIGTPASVVVRELSPPVVTETPLILDDLTPDELVHRQIFSSRKVATVRKRLFQAVPGHPDKLIDLFQSAVDAGFLSVHGSHFRMNVQLRVAYPADPADTSKIARPPLAGAKYPLVVLLHGNAAGWSVVPGSAATPTGDTHQGKTLHSVPLRSQANHAGYDYLQHWLGENGRRMVSVSIDTNVANTVGALTDLRAQMVLDVLAKLQDEAKKADSVFSQVDFQNIGLVGHSRGGEAVVLAQQLNSGNSTFAIKAVCALAPTDVRGGTTSPLSVAKASNASLLVVYGGLDLDVSGSRSAGTRDTWGNGFRLYDRSTAHKAMAFLPFCCHTRFNQTWDAVGRQRALAQGLPAGAQIEGGQPLPANTHSTPLHEALAREYIGGYFDLALNRDFGLRALFDNSLRNAPVKPAALQWRFGALTEAIDEFDAPNPLATLPAGATRIELTPIVVPAGATLGSRDKHVLHSTQALLIDFAAVAAASASVGYRFAAGAGATRDLMGFDAITFRLGVLYPVADQAAIEAAADPVFTVSLTDKAGVTGSLTSAEMFADLANGWTKPAFKRDGSDNATLMFMQTVPFNFATLLLKRLNQGLPEVKLDEAESLSIEFDTSAGSGEIWLDSLLLIKV